MGEKDVCNPRHQEMAVVEKLLTMVISILLKTSVIKVAQKVEWFYVLV